MAKKKKKKAVKFPRSGRTGRPAARVRKPKKKK